MRHTSHSTTIFLEEEELEEEGLNIDIKHIGCLKKIMEHISL